MARGIIIRHPLRVYRRLSRNEWASAVTLYRKGVSAAGVARKFKISIGNMTSGLRRRGLEIRGAWKRRILDWAKIALLYGKGYSARQIGRLYQVPHSTIARGLRSRNFSIRRRVKHFIRLSALERAYIAGLFDGEGSILVALNDTSRAKGSHWAYITLTNTNRPVIDFLHRKLHGHIKLATRSTLSKKPCWVWCATSRHALLVLKMLHPYLRIKKARAKLVFALYERIDRYKAGHAISSMEFQARDRIRMKIRRHNGRGIVIESPSQEPKKYDYLRHFKPASPDQE